MPLLRQSVSVACNNIVSSKSMKSLKDIICCLSFVLSIALVVWGINIYRLTIISPFYLFVVAAIGTVIALPLIKYLFKSSYKLVWRFFISLAIGGGTFYFCFLYLNSKFSVNQEVTEILKIDKTGTLGKGRYSNCNKPYALVSIKGIEKELLFSCDYEKSIITYSEIQLAYSNGLFGFYVIQEMKLLK